MFEEGPGPAAAGEIPIQKIPRRWLMETGSPLHLGLASISVNLHTANGPANCGEAAPQQIAAFGDGADPYSG